MAIYGFYSTLIPHIVSHSFKNASKQTWLTIFMLIFTLFRYTYSKLGLRRFIVRFNCSISMKHEIPGFTEFRILPFYEANNFGCTILYIGISNFNQDKKEIQCQNWSSCPRFFQTFLKVSKSQKQFLLKPHSNNAKNERNIRQN